MKKDDMMLVKKLLFFIGLLIIMGIGAILYTNGDETDNLKDMITGGMIMVLVLVIMLEVMIEKNRSRTLNEIEELKTDLAILQNRCDWLEDDICKEWHEETKPPQFPHNIEDDMGE